VGRCVSSTSTNSASATTEVRDVGSSDDLGRGVGGEKADRKNVALSW
jgi:hypothetical protein